jgi:hypothetical protein
MIIMVVTDDEQDKKEPNSIVVPGCPPILDWGKMEAEEGEITLVRQVPSQIRCLTLNKLNLLSISTQAENAPELNTTNSIFKSVSVCSPDLDLSKVRLRVGKSQIRFVSMLICAQGRHRD